MKRRDFIKATAATLFSASVLPVTGCGGGNNPKAVAVTFMTAMGRGNLDEAKKYCTKDTAKVVGMMQAMGEGEKKEFDKNFKCTAKSVKVEGDTAVVELKCSDGEDMQVNLVKLDGQWKVDLDK